MNLPARNSEGYLIDASAWSEAVAQTLASERGLTLTPAHLELLQAMRSYCLQLQLKPAMRVYIKYLEKTLGPEKGNSAYLQTLFPGTTGISSLALVCLLAGLPKPLSCV